MARGGKRIGAGRKVGSLTKATVDIKALAQQYTGPALAELARLSTAAQSEAARVAAIKELLDRGHGKSAQPIEHGGQNGGPLQVTFVKLDPEAIR